MDFAFPCSTSIDCAPGTDILVGTVKIMPTVLTNQMIGIFRWGIIKNMQAPPVIN